MLLYYVYWVDLKGTSMYITMLEQNKNTS